MGLAIYVGSSSVVSMELKWVRRSNGSSDDASKNPSKFRDLSASALALPPSIPIFISTTKRDVSLQELRDLYVQCNHSCNRLHNNGSFKEIMDMKKLHTAISHSAIVVSVFCKSHDVSCFGNEKVDDASVLYSDLSSPDIVKQSKSVSLVGDLFKDVLPVSPSNGQLVGFGRAVSDCGLTASIYDIMCFPGYSFTTANGDW